MNYDTVCETAIEFQPMDTNEPSVNSIRSLMKEARGINNSFLHEAMNYEDPMSTVNLNEENPFIEDDGLFDE